MGVDAGMSGTEIYSRALRAWSTQNEPPYLMYDVIATLSRHGRVREQRERVLLRTADRAAIIETSGRTTVGRPRFVPNVAFRLVNRGAASVNMAPEATGSPEPSEAPATIGHVEAQTNRYKVTLLAEETYHGRTVYHLALTPLFDPKRNAVRAMWVDTTTFVTWRITAEAPYAVGVAHGTFFLDAEYAPVAAAWLLTEVNTSGALHFGFIAFGGDARVRFANVGVPIRPPPGYCFERSGFNVHETECRAALR